MNIDKAIEIEQETSKTFERFAEVFEQFGKTEHADACKAGAEEHRDVMNWLKALKEIFQGKYAETRLIRKTEDGKTVRYCEKCNTKVGVYKTIKFCPNCGAEVIE